MRTPSQRGRGAKQKGANGEREALQLLTVWASSVYEGLGLECPIIRRNLEQTRSGGCDLIGLEWLSIEVKRVETEYQSKWWLQCITATKPDQVPLLMFRRNGGKWHSMTRQPVLLSHDTVVSLDMRLDVEQLKHWFQWALYDRLKQK